MKQLSLFDDENCIKQVIPKDVVSPLESNKGVNTEEFRKQQLLFSKYVHAIQKAQNCSWFKARELFFKHRDSQEPISMLEEINDTKVLK